MPLASSSVKAAATKPAGAPLPPHSGAVARIPKPAPAPQADVFSDPDPSAKEAPATSATTTTAKTAAPGLGSPKKKAAAEFDYSLLRGQSEENLINALKDRDIRHRELLERFNERKKTNAKTQQMLQTLIDKVGGPASAPAAPAPGVPPAAASASPPTTLSYSQVAAARGAPSLAPLGPPNGHALDGLCLFVSSQIRPYILSVSAAEFTIRIKFRDGFSAGFVYLPPRLSSNDCVAALAALAGCQVISGDWNVQFGESYGCGDSTTFGPRLDSLLPWLQHNELYVLHPSCKTTPHLDHVLISMPLRECSHTALYILPNSTTSATFGTDHPTLDLHLSFQSCLQPLPGCADTSDSIRPNLSRLREEAGRASLCAAYNSRALLVSLALDEAESAVNGRSPTLTERQDAVDFADEVCHRALLDSAFKALGSYSAKQVRRHRDLEATRLEREALQSTTAGLRRWKKAQRGRTRFLVATEGGLGAGRSVEEDALWVWGQVWGSEEPRGEVPEGLEDWGVGELVNVNDGELHDEFSDDAIRKAIRRYPKHKTGGEDGDHAVLLAALTPSSTSD
ncbi:unnamed protein product [Tilletia controversa]|nr:unnamed protein product [Tilletia controversa]